MIFDPLGWRLLSTFLAAYAGASLVAAAYDLLAPAARIAQYKTAAHCRSDILNVYRIAAARTAFNMLITVPAGVLLFRPFIHPYDHFSYSELWKLPLFYVISDACFYGTHRMFHTPWLFARLHRIHHRLTAPVGFAAVYAHPLEVLFGNILSVMLPPIVLGASVPVYQLWITLAILNTVLVSHAGIARISEYHDLHHQRMNVNLGAELGLMDRLGGTHHLQAAARNHVRPALR